MHSEVAGVSLLARLWVLGAVAGLGAAGCAPDYPSLDDACRESPPSPRGASQVTTAAAARLNCHRRFLGLRELRIQEPLQEAAQSHSDYLVTHGPADEADLHLEDSSLEGSLGATLGDRLLATGIDSSLPGQNRPIEVIYETTAERPTVDIVDRMMRRPASAGLLLAPGATSVGFGRAEGIATAVLLAGTPSNEAVSEPILWPASGQLEVPRTALTAWSELQVSGLPDDITLDPFSVPGHAITILVGGTVETDAVEGTPYGLSIDEESVVFAGPDGELEVAVVGPSFFVDDHDALHLLPLYPLAPGTTYTLDADVTWGSPAVTSSISMWFRTVEE